MNQLSKDIISLIYEYLPLNDIYNCSVLNKLFNRAFNSELLWYCKITSQYANDIFKLYKFNTYIETFKNITIDVNKYLDLIANRKFTDKNYEHEFVL